MLCYIMSALNHQTYRHKNEMGGVDDGHFANSAGLVAIHPIADALAAEVPFTGKVEGQREGKVRDGKIEGEWVTYHDNGQLSSKRIYRDGELVE